MATDRAPGELRPGAWSHGESLGPCPGCGAGLLALLHPTGVGEGVGHYEPTCEDYDNRDAEAFLFWFIEQRTNANT